MADDEDDEYEDEEYRPDQSVKPQCCQYASTFIVLRYATYWVEDKDYFYKNKPFWIIRGSDGEVGFPVGLDAAYTIRQIHFCPSCGLKLPDLVKKKELPEKVMTIDDGGDYCATCKDRVSRCRCLPPEEIWELSE